jgi:hypothetical protein
MDEETENPYFGPKGEIENSPKKKKRKSKLPLDSLREICSTATPIEREKPKEVDPLDW